MQGKDQVDRTRLLEFYVLQKSLPMIIFIFCFGEVISQLATLRRIDLNEMCNGGKSDPT